MRWPLLLLSTLLVACPTTTPSTHAGIPVVPDAVVDVAFADVGVFAATVSRLSRAGLLPDEARVLSQSGLEAAGIAAPLVVAVREGGDVVLAARLVDAVRFQAALATALPKGLRSERRFGRVDAIVDDAGSVAALIRADDGVVVVVAAPVDPWGAATFIEALASGALPAERRDPKTTELHTGIALRRQIEGLEGLSGTLRVDGDDLALSLSARTSGALSELASGLSSSAPPFACAVEEGAALALRLPPLGASALAGLVSDAGHLDGFVGRVVLALHEPPAGTPVIADDKASWASIVVAGLPRAGGVDVLRQTLNSAGPAPVARTVGTRQVQELSVGGKPWRQVSAVVDDDLFALSVGAPVVVDRAAVGSSCAPAPGRLLVVDGPRLLRIVGRASPELALLRSLGVDGAVLPGAVRLLSAIERLEIAAVKNGSDVNVDVGLRLR